MNILFLASEVQGLVKTGGLADVARSLPAALKSAGHDVRIVMPCYRKLIEADYPEAVTTLIVPLNHNDVYYCTVHETKIDNVTIYLIDHDQFFGRHGIYDDGMNAYDDNVLRFAFMSKAALELAKAIDFRPDIVHCNDWQAAIAPFYLKEHYKFDEFYANTKSVLTIHNGAYQGNANGAWTGKLGIDDKFFQSQMFETYGGLNLSKGGLHFADKINAVSPGYRDELLAEETSHGLSWYYGSREKDFTGILNGCDYGQWDAEIDPALPAPYSIEDMSGKAVCKAELQKEAGLEVNADIPLFASISRLTDQKGFDFLIPALFELAKDNVQILLLGSGELRYCHQLQHLAHQYPKNVRFISGYNEPLSHRIEAGADYFMMPSVFEPCGLNQIYSLKYGTVPIVRATGGLRDTVEGINEDESNLEQATGLSFNHCDAQELLWQLRRASWIFEHNKASYLTIQKNGMQQEFLWSTAADQYIELYKEALNS
jgi:starch synthase